MNKRAVVTTMAFVTATANIFPLVAQASSSNFDYRKKVVGISGIMQNVSTNLNENVTRQQFAKMLVNASTFRDYLPVSSNVAVYADVPASNEYASSIRIAAEQKWMVGYLGGLFKPEQPVTLQEAARAVLALLEYTDEDFGGNLSAARMAKFYALDLNEELDRQNNEILTKTDCINLFYNLLKAETKSTGRVYATVLGCDVNSDGEVNPLGLAETNLKGPKLVRNTSQLSNYIPFNVQEASVYIDGDASSYDGLRNVLSSGYAVVYYNQSAKTIWAYTAPDDGESDVQTGRCVIRGTIENIYYASSDVMTPTRVILEGRSDELQLSSSDMQFAFSIYGSLRVGDKVTLVCEKTVNSNDEATYTVIDYVEE